MSAESLKEKMRDFAAGRVGAVKVTGADLANAGSGDGGSQGPAEPTKGTVEAPVPEEAKKDVFSDAGGASDMHRGLATSFIEDKIDISEEDREAFLQALVTGGRYERPFSLFGGKLKGVFRCRKIAESDGIIAWLTHCINSKQVEVRVEYLTMMRNALLAAQVKSLRGIISEDFPEFAAPYGPMRSADGGAVEAPAWVKAANAWGERPEALVTALHAELNLFERRYWAMIMDASNQNFWNPAASI